MNIRTQKELVLEFSVAQRNESAPPRNKYHALLH